jgi:uncharacterized protein YcbX
MIVGKIYSLWRFPVKSLQGEKLNHVELGRQGLLGDRAYALIDKENGKVVSAKNVRLFPNLLQCKAVYLQNPTMDQPVPPVQITLADGTTICSESANADEALSAYFDRDVTLVRVDAAQGHIHFMDAYPVSVITTSTLENLNSLSPETNFDVRRFRMNIVIKTYESGFVENSWVGRAIDVGTNINLQIVKPDARCVMTTLAQDDLPKDLNVLRTLVKHNAVKINEKGEEPCAGVYAFTSGEGLISVNDDVTLE